MGLLHPAGTATASAAKCNFSLSLYHSILPIKTQESDTGVNLLAQRGQEETS